MRELVWRGGLAVMGILVVDAGLEFLGGTVPRLARDTDVWGTYADWAAAIIPAAALIFSVQVWRTERAQQEVTDTERALTSSLNFDNPDDSVRYLHNRWSRSVRVLSSGADVLDQVIVPGSSFRLVEQDDGSWPEVVVSVEGVGVWRLRDGALPERLG